MPSFEVPVLVRLHVDARSFADAADVAQRAVESALFEANVCEDLGRYVIPVRHGDRSREAIVNRVVTGSMIQAYGRQFPA